MLPRSKIPLFSRQRISMDNFPLKQIVSFTASFWLNQCQDRYGPINKIHNLMQKAQA